VKDSPSHRNLVLAKRGAIASLAIAVFVVLWDRWIVGEVEYGAGIFALGVIYTVSNYYKYRKLKRQGGLEFIGDDKVEWPF